MLKRFSAAIIAGAVLAACAEPSTSTGVLPVPELANQSILAELTCRVDVAASSMSCAPSRPLSSGGAAFDLILGGQNTYVKMTSTNVVTTPTVSVTADVTVQNLTAQPWATVDGTTSETSGVRVFFVQLPNNGVTVANPDSTNGTFTGTNQTFFKYTGANLGADGILASGEVSSAKSWQFNLNGGAAVFTFSVLISAKMPDEPGVLRWTSTTLTEAAATESKEAIWGSSSTDVWAGGTAGATTLHRWNGSSWTAEAGAETTPILSIWGSASNNVYAVGSSKIQQYNGTSWADVSSGTANALYAVWGSSAADVYAGGFNGTLVHSTGGAFTAVASTGLGTDYVYAIWGSGPNDVYIGGTGVRRWNGTSWSAVTTGVTTGVRAIWGSSASDVWVGGASGALARWNGTAWSTVSGFGTADIRGIWGTAANNVYMVNQSGEVWHWNNVSWVKHTVSNTAFTDIWGSGGLDVWAVGSNTGFSDNIVVRGTR